MLSNEITILDVVLKDSTTIATHPALTLSVFLQVVEDPVPVPDGRRHSAEFASFVGDCMAKDPFKRPCADALLSHPFILKACSPCVLVAGCIHE